MEQIPENEQWKLNGICSKCRRENYCKKRCKVSDNRHKYIVRRMMDNALNEATGGAYGEIMNSFNRTLRR